MNDAIRVYALARHLSVDSKEILRLCEKLGFEARSSLSELDAEQRRFIERIIGRDNPGDETSPALVPAWRPPPTLQETVRLKPHPDQSTQS
jgi:hypothetical protein